MIADLAKKLRTPRAVQTYLRNFQYNNQETMRSAAAALRAGKAHCMEGVFIAAAILEHHHYPPLVLSMESQDRLDHVVFVFKQNSRWGAIGRSRDQGLHGRAPVYRSIRDLVWSYFDPYVDKTGRITAYQLLHLDQSKADWRNSKAQLWTVEKYLINLHHKALPSSDRRYKKLHRDYLRHGALKIRKNWW